jgi:YjbE family integral membrane protein
MLMQILATHQFWIGFGTIFVTNLLLSGDNAVVIALAANSLPANQQKKAIVFGSMAAAVLLVLFTIFAVALLQLPFLKVLGGCALLWVGIQLLAGEDEDENDIQGHTHLLHAIRTILIANLVMSVDNTLAVASVAEQVTAGIDESIRQSTKYVLLALGLGVSIPVVVFGSALVMKVMTRFPIIVTLGGALLGFIAGEMLVSDPAVHDWVEHMAPWLEDQYVASIVCALIVVAVGTWMARRHQAADPA